MTRAAKAGVAYFALIFALGFVLGTIRILWLAPIVGQTGAVLAELPAMLLASWFAAGWLLWRFRLSGWIERTAMGVSAFTLLIAAEAALGILVVGESPGQWFAALFRIPGIIGLAGQIGFAAMPLVVWTEKRPAQL